MRLGDECMYNLNYSRTGLSNLCVIISPHSVFDSELKQHKFAEESWKENKNPVNTRKSVHRIPTKSKV